MSYDMLVLGALITCNICTLLAANGLVGIPNFFSAFPVFFYLQLEVYDMPCAEVVLQKKTKAGKQVKRR